MLKTHPAWSSPGGRGFVERTWRGQPGVYVLSLSTGLIKVGMSVNLGNRVSEHLRYCAVYGVKVLHLDAIQCNDPRQVERDLIRWLVEHPSSVPGEWTSESVYGLSFAQVVRKARELAGAPRVCFSCGKDVSHRRADAGTCGQRCRKSTNRTLAVVPIAA